jgi:hypothetical protein
MEKCLIESNNNPVVKHLGIYKRQKTLKITAEHSDRDVKVMNYLPPLKYRGRWFEPCLRHGCLVCAYNVCVALCVENGLLTG